MWLEGDYLIPNWSEPGSPVASPATEPSVGEEGEGWLSWLRGSEPEVESVAPVGFPSGFLRMRPRVAALRTSLGVEAALAALLQGRPPVELDMETVTIPGEGRLESLVRAATPLVAPPPRSVLEAAVDRLVTVARDGLREAQRRRVDYQPRPDAISEGYRRVQVIFLLRGLRRRGPGRWVRDLVRAWAEDDVVVEQQREAEALVRQDEEEDAIERGRRWLANREAEEADLVSTSAPSSGASSLSSPPSEVDGDSQGGGSVVPSASAGPAAPTQAAPLPVGELGASSSVGGTELPCEAELGLFETVVSPSVVAEAGDLASPQEVRELATEVEDLVCTVFGERFTVRPPPPISGVSAPWVCKPEDLLVVPADAPAIPVASPPSVPPPPVVTVPSSPIMVSSSSPSSPSSMSISMSPSLRPRSPPSSPILVRSVSSSVFVARGPPVTLTTTASPPSSVATQLAVREDDDCWSLVREAFIWPLFNWRHCLGFEADDEADGGDAPGGDASYRGPEAPPSSVAWNTREPALLDRFGRRQFHRTSRQLRRERERAREAGRRLLERAELVESPSLDETRGHESARRWRPRRTSAWMRVCRRGRRRLRWCRRHRRRIG